MKAVSEQWPKKLSAMKYTTRWHVDRTKESIINDIKAGRLPGGQEASGAWYVWVHADLSPAHGYQGPDFSPQQGSGTGNAVADKILERRVS